ncbi:hypothetical protein AAW14_04285 [Streptomyces hygroscopicus]|nr:hypothetical protein [Streptomyces hygroscopicus]
MGPPPARALSDLFELTCDRSPSATAVVCGPQRLDYVELDRRANRLAHLLRARGATARDRMGILLERSCDTYVALLGVLKAGAAYVPLDPSFPTDRLAFIAHDAGLRELVTASALRARTGDLPCAVLEVDRVEDRLSLQPDIRPAVGVEPSDECYVVYTSGTTGRPKGVAVSHASIVNFLRVVAPVYRVTAEDRVYQGLSIAFDFAIEEIWPTWMAGATLVAAPAGARLAGPELRDFLAGQDITVLCCVPTLLTTLDAEVPSLRSLLVSGETCPPDLVRRWWRPGRRILNAYGPTETTVTATCAELHPHRPVTIGTPLPTYRVYILDDRLRPVAAGDSGEICIGGPGVALGYVNRSELTAERFVPNPVPRDRAAVPRIYRTGDRGRVTATGEIEYQGRTDTQVKIRGYRIELAEIEEILREDEAVESAVVAPRERDGTAPDLIGYVTLHDRSAAEDGEVLRDRLRTALRRRLPEYMIPAWVEVLPALPLLAADKVDRAALPAPTSRPLACGSRSHVSAATPQEERLAELWQNVLGRGPISVEDDFFRDLGGHSMTAAVLVSRLRRDEPSRDVAMGDLYAHPTVRGLAAFIEAGLGTPDAPRPSSAAPVQRRSSVQVTACGVAQLAALYAWLLLPGLTVVLLPYRQYAAWHGSVPGAAADGILGSLVHMPLGPFLALEAAWLALTLLPLPLLVCRLLMTGVRAGTYPLWGVTYLRFWLHGRLLALTPLRLLGGSPLLAPCLRLLGARVGRGCHLQAVLAPLSLLEIGDGASIGYGARLQTYAVEGGRLRLAPVRIGTGAFVGANSVVQPGAVIGDHASVGEQSLVPEDGAVPPHEHWAGSPVTRQDAPPALLQDMAAQADDGPWPVHVLAGHVAGALLILFIPLLVIGAAATFVGYTAVRHGIGWAIASTAVAGPLVVAATCVCVLVVKRAVMPRTPAGIHAERSGFGVRKWISDGLMAISLTMTQALYSTLYLVPFLRAMGARTGRWSEVATVSFVDPDMLVTGEQCFLADVSVVGSAVFHRGRVAIAPAEIGRRSFVGNGALVPGSHRLGDDSLLGVHSLAPPKATGPETTWLGSPAIFLPSRQASQEFPQALTYLPSRGLIAARLAVEYFRVTLPATCSTLGLLGLLYAWAALAAAVPPLAVVVLGPALLLGSDMGCALVAVALKWAVIGRYRPRVEPLWSVWVRRTELITGLYENLVAPLMMNLFIGSPWAAMVLRLFGARIGRRVWLNTTFLTEFDLVRLGDDAAVGEVTSLQTHLFEDRVMKMSRVTVEAAASVGTRSVVLYDARVGEGACLDAMSLAMKGESLPAGTRWRGIPAAPRRADEPTAPTKPGDPS